MNKSDLIKNNPYSKYANDRSRELIKKLARSFIFSSNSSIAGLIAKLCYMVSLDESQILQNQAVLDDRSLDNHENTRDDLLSLFSKSYIQNELLDHGKNQTLLKFQHKDGGVK